VSRIQHFSQIAAVILILAKYSKLKYRVVSKSFNMQGYCSDIYIYIV
jgi:hypothetical protein